MKQKLLHLSDHCETLCIFIIYNMHTLTTSTNTKKKIHFYWYLLFFILPTFEVGKYARKYIIVLLELKLAHFSFPELSRSFS